MPLGGTPGPPSVVRLGCPSPDRELFGPTATTGSMEIHIPESESTKIDQKKSYLVLSCLINSRFPQDKRYIDLLCEHTRRKTLVRPRIQSPCRPNNYCLVYFFVCFVCVCVWGGTMFFLYFSYMWTSGD